MKRLLFVISAFLLFASTSKAQTQSYWNGWAVGHIADTANSVGSSVFDTLSFTQGLNAGTATAGTGDTIQVTKTGVTTSSLIMVSYADTTSGGTGVQCGILRRQSGKFTIIAKNGHVVNYWIAKF